MKKDNSTVLHIFCSVVRFSNVYFLLLNRVVSTIRPEFSVCLSEKAKIGLVLYIISEKSERQVRCEILTLVDSVPVNSSTNPMFDHLLESSR